MDLYCFFLFVSCYLEMFLKLSGFFPEHVRKCSQKKNISKSLIEFCILCTPPMVVVVWS